MDVNDREHVDVAFPTRTPPVVTNPTGLDDHA
jgi:hypothetical protein